MPEGDAELPDDALPEDMEEEDEEDCAKPADIFRSRIEDLGGELYER